MFEKLISIHQCMSTISFKTFSGSFSRYWNEIAFLFLHFFQNMRKSKISIHKLSPQPVVKDSVDLFQGIAMTFFSFKNVFFSI